MYLWLFGDPDCLPVLTHLRNRRFYVRTLLGVFQTLIEHGAAVIVIEHDLDLIHDADYLIDMGPGGGEAGGRVVAEGTTEEIKKSSYSITGQYLK